MDLPYPHQKGVSLSNFSTLGIGGPARYFAEVFTSLQMQQWIQYAHQHTLPFLILGKGSNALFDDRGFNGLVLLNKIDTLEEEPEGIFHVGSGYSFARLGSQTARHGWSGLEFASGIPATVGGAIYMNAGANGMETADTLFQVHWINEKGEESVKRIRKNDFGYRTSPFQKMKGGIVRASFSLQRSEKAGQTQKGLLNYRLKTQPYGEKSAGCAFRNPHGGVAGQLIERCGLKGAHVGGAWISQMHGNFIVNKGEAQAQDVLNLMKIVKEKIFQMEGIVLQEEIHYIPYES